MGGNFDGSKQHVLELVTEETAATNPIAIPSSALTKAQIEAGNANDRKMWIVGRATRDCSAAIW